MGSGFTLSRAVAAVTVAAAVASGAGVASADYEGSGDTGWRHSNKRDCCEEAVTLAQNDSMAACTDAGGVPRLMGGARRGLCNWEARGDAEDVLYRCTAVTSVICR